MAVLLPRGCFLIDVLPVIRRPNRLSNEETHRFDVVTLIIRKAVVYSFGKNDHITGFNADSNPLILFVAHIKVAAAFDTVADLFVEVDMLLVEGEDLLLITGELLRAAVDNIRIRVAAFRPNLMTVYDVPLKYAFFPEK